MTKNALVAATLSFFLLGAGFVYNGKKMVLGLGLTIGAGIMTYVELTLQSENSNLFPFSFVAFFIMACVCAFEAFTEAKTI